MTGPRGAYSCSNHRTMTRCCAAACLVGQWCAHDRERPYLDVVFCDDLDRHRPLGAGVLGWSWNGLCGPHGRLERPQPLCRLVTWRFEAHTCRRSSSVARCWPLQVLARVSHVHVSTGGRGVDRRGRRGAYCYCRCLQQRLYVLDPPNAGERMPRHPGRPSRGLHVALLQLQPFMARRSVAGRSQLTLNLAGIR